MRTINRRKLQVLSPSLAILIFLATFSPPGFTAPPPAGGQRFFVTAAAGFFYHGQDALRKIYEKPAWPVELQLGWELNRGFQLFGAARYERTSGDTLLLSPQQPDESYALRLEILCLRLGMNYSFRPGRFTPFVGAGILYAFFRETWLDLPVEAQGRKAGFFAAAGGHYRLGRSFRLLAQLDYSSIPVGAGNGLAERVNLGGLSLMLGLGCGIF